MVFYVKYVSFKSWTVNCTLISMSYVLTTPLNIISYPALGFFEQSNWIDYLIMSKKTKTATLSKKSRNKHPSNHFLWCFMWNTFLYCYHFLLSLKTNQVPKNYIVVSYSQYTDIVGKYEIHLHSLRNDTEKLTKAWLFYLFLKLVQINYIFSNNVSILYISWTLKSVSLNKSTSVLIITNIVSSNPTQVRCTRYKIMW
jgi:hypothetical protein